ncbi:MAG: sensor domain-containing diguanylate cyclase [Lachnospiraceae bacterium]|nr:sensor domain-containing diguanylate cyclase [Lachnospiraceae bacterium]
MDTRPVFEIQKKGVLLHRLVYILFLLQRVLLQMLQREVSLVNTTIVIAIIIVFMTVEEVLYSKNYFDNVRCIQVFRYVQCLLSSILIGFIQIQDGSEVCVIALPLLFMLDFFLTMGIVDKSKLISYSAMVGGPIVLLIMVKILFTPEYNWLLLLFDVLIILVIIFFEAYFFVECFEKIEKQFFSQNRKVEDVIEKNEKILRMQEKVKKTNEQLTLQKVDLQKANSLIQTANKEMMAQAEILRYISMSFDLSKISNQITDAIMVVKQLSFCGVYIKEGAYLNNHASYVIKTTIGQLYQKIKSSLPEIYELMVNDDIMELTLYDEDTNQVPFLQNVNINSVYIKVLRTDEETYGLFIIGDNRKGLFKENMSFYDAIITQYDIAIHNARIYAEMQQMARKDGLTGINNRIYFNELFATEMQRVIEEDTHMSVALFDIDKFKSVNDTHGHLAGDEVLKRIAFVTENCIEKYNGFVCRYGGEEFVVALPNMKLEAAYTIIEELFDELCSQVVKYNEFEIPISVSIGLTSYPEICKRQDELLKRADWCMYYAKKHGRHQINVDDGSIESI